MKHDKFLSHHFHTNIFLTTHLFDRVSCKLLTSSLNRLLINKLENNKILLRYSSFPSFLLSLLRDVAFLGVLYGVKPNSSYAECDFGVVWL